MTDGGIRLQLLNMAERYDQEAEHNERQHQVRAEKAAAHELLCPPLYWRPTTMRVMANKYGRLAEQPTVPRERDRYRTYARFHSEMAVQQELAELGVRLKTNQVRTSRQ
jgi:hypothetical protein